MCLSNANTNINNKIFNTMYLTSSSVFLSSTMNSAPFHFSCILLRHIKCTKNSATFLQVRSNRKYVFFFLNHFRKPNPAKARSYVSPVPSATTTTNECDRSRLPFIRRILTATHLFPLLISNLRIKPIHTSFYLILSFVWRIIYVDRDLPVTNTLNVFISIFLSWPHTRTTNPFLLLPCFNAFMYTKDILRKIRSA